jgi:hypothetical protein
MRASGGPQRAFRIAGAELSPALWLDDARLVLIERRTDASGAAHGTVHLLTITEDGLTDAPVAEGGDVRVVGWLR